MPKFLNDPSRGRTTQPGARPARSRSKPQVERIFAQMQLPFDAWHPSKAEHVGLPADSTVDLETFQQLLVAFLVRHNAGPSAAQAAMARGGSRGESRHD